MIVNYNTSDRTAKVSDSDNNFRMRTIIFNPSEILKTISFGIRGDRKLLEADKTFFVNLYDATNAAIANNSKSQYKTFLVPSLRLGMHSLSL
ncbi:hypothetical protein HUN01_06190 [Nostoc edaphicum CCNP1411]|uniref:Uncharacterized protein n=1 Tax=Nostoc edaphicum CCNP1411 TaxID=1472755 RepID=A0A7D7LAW3_9NOSO|nr:Calx-beta domain-containing protein [Nostoc edaphicum]QMS87190.1 hypothetical protein HUN01_06190 [Nostoc edaphicum CCNP1411]